MSVSAVRQRVGWLLRVNRKLGADEELRVGKTFARAFSDAGGRSDATAVSRWERGLTAISTATVARYETLLGLERGSLTTLKNAIERAAGVTSKPDGASDRPRFHELMERSTSRQEMGGLRWTELSDHVKATPELVLHPPRLWDEIIRRLLGELVVAEHHGWLQRQEALSRLMEHPAAGVTAVRACIELAEDSTPVVIEPLSLLEASPDPGANRHIRRTIESPGSDRALLGALLAASRKIRYRHFTAQDSRRIGGAVTSLLRDATIDAGISRLASEVKSSLDAGRSPGGNAVSAWAGSPRPRRIATRAYVRVASDGPSTDETLTELVGEALHGPNPDDRMLATMVIAGTPIREAVAACLLAEIEDDLRHRRGGDLDMSLRTMTQLRSAGHRPVLNRILTDPHAEERIRLAAARALPHCAKGSVVTPWAKILMVQTDAARKRPSKANEAILHGVVYGAGTDGDEATLRRALADAGTPTMVRSTARWLLSAGG